MSIGATRAAGIALLTAGLVILAWVAGSLARPDAEGHRYEFVEEGVAGEFQDLALDDWPELPIQRYEIHAPETDFPLARVLIGSDREGKPLLLEWQNLTTEPVITQTASLAELRDLARAITVHTPDDALILAWWDVSRQLELLSGRETLFETHLGEPLLLPHHWSGIRSAIQTTERNFWQDGGSTEAFMRFTEALLQNESTGAEQLRALSGNRPSYLVLHVADAYKMGALYPERFGTGYRDFANTGQTHGLIGRVKEWLRVHDYPGYTIAESSLRSFRVQYLTDEPTTRTLLAQALPFSTSKVMMSQDLEPVYQQGGFWVYRLAQQGRGVSTESHAASEIYQ
ncbi:hydroxylamine oxidation protein HaoB [Thioalkalicoccus limnaeus]|uniref:Hydroxylamine oxidation protein HaoB n=1 Tax=Thioalkalicoccus limnaeus TaxID=120681 RepID=A0ABV4BLL3_9GAMM